VKGEAKRRALGKGLDSLIPEFSDSDALLGREGGSPSAGTPAEIALDQIKPNPHQPRTHFDPVEIDALAASIRSSGILQPLLLRQEKDGGYTLIAGERRLRAARLAGLATVPAIVRELADERMLEFALIENLQRDDLGALETAQAFRALVRRFRLTQAEVASRVGMPRSSVTNYLRLLDLPEEVQDLIAEGHLNMGHGRALAGLDDAQQQLRLANQAVEGAWSVRRVEEKVRRLAEPDAVLPVDFAPSKRRDPNVLAAEESLSRALGARVAIKRRRGQRGWIEIRFAGDDDLDRLYRLLLGLEGTSS